ncbi:MAG: amidohydrolase [Clostridia bacterium]|nr:amidohydrolase [Clostridia bacterium]
MKLDATKFREQITAAQDYIWANPETGYKEWKTHEYMKKVFLDLGYEITEAGNIPGFYTVIDTGRKGPEVLVMAEMDSLLCANHPDADPETGAVHCCGHSAQCAAMVGIASALKEDGALDGLSGRIRLALVPAEELIEIGYRTQLRKQGIIKYFGGKTEFLYRGYFDGVDIAFMIHSSLSDVFAVRPGSVGLVAKKVTYKGVSSHAGGSPWNGKNSLYAATNGLSAANALRETFKEEDLIRFHPIITEGGTAVNAIPEKTVIESYVRGKTYDAIIAANKNINRALIGTALSLDTNIEISDMPGYAPLNNAEGMIKLFEDAVKGRGYPYQYLTTRGTGSTDMGDISGIMPAVHPYAPGAVGISHGSNYYIKNIDTACVGSANVQLEMLSLLLSKGGERAREILENFTPQFESKEAYLSFIDSLVSEGERITYEDGKAIIRL